tara:strand:+ start:616 stop:837 length:222 start_codon:yes stop_codon:yes gene_type:complete
MSIAKNARASQIMNDIQNGKHTPVNKRGRFANFGSIAEDSIYYHTMLADQANAKQKAKAQEAKARLRLKGIII